MTDRLGRTYRDKPGRKPDPEATSLGDGCSRFGIRIAPVEKERLKRVAAENGLTISELLRLAVTTLVSDYVEGEVRIFVRRSSDVSSVLVQERMF